MHFCLVKYCIRLNISCIDPLLSFAPVSNVLACIQVAVRVRDKNDAPLMSIDDLLNQFKDDVASFR